MSEIFGNEQAIQNLDKTTNALDSLQTKLLITQYSTAALDVVTKKFSTGSLNNVVTGFGKFKTNLDEFAKSGNKVETVFKSFTKTTDVLNKSVEKTDTLLARVSKNAAKFGSALDVITTGVFAIKGFNVISDGISKINAEVNKLNASLAILNKSGIDTSNLIALQAFSDALTNFDAKNVEEFSTTFVAMYKQTTTLMSQIATQTTNEIEAYNNKIKGSVDQSRSYLEKYFDDMQDMVNTKLRNTVTSTDALRASYTGLQAGLKPGVELTNAVANSLKLMTTQGGDADQIMTLLVQTMTAYNMSAGESGKIMAKINELVNIGITDVPQLQQGFGQLAVTAAATNVSLDDMSGGLAVLTTNGYSTARAFTGLQNLFNQISSGDITQRLIASGAKYIENGKLMQATLDSQTIASKGLANALNDVYKAVGGNKAKMQELIPDMEAYGAAIALTGEKAKTLKDAIERISNVTVNNLEKAFNIKIDEDKVLNFSRLINRTTELMIRFGRLLAPIFEEGLTHLEKLTSFSETMVKNYGSVISTVVKLTLSLKAVTAVVGVFVSKILALGGLVLAWRMSTGAILGDLNKLRMAIFNTGDALAGYNLLWDKNVSGLRKVRAVMGQLLGLHSLESKAIEGLSAIEGKRLGQDVKDTALRIRNNQAEIASLDAKIARYETLRRINAENYDPKNPAESIFALGEIAKNKNKRLGELSETRLDDLVTMRDYKQNRKDLKTSYQDRVLEVQFSKELTEKEKVERLAKLEQSYTENKGKLVSKFTQAKQRTDEVDLIQSESAAIYDQIEKQKKLNTLTENLETVKNSHVRKIKKLEEAVEKETDAVKKVKIKNKIDRLKDNLTSVEKTVNDYQMGKAAYGTTLSQQEIYEGQKALGIKSLVDKGENKYFWEPFKFNRDNSKSFSLTNDAGDVIAGRNLKNSQKASNIINTYDPEVLTKAWAKVGTTIGNVTKALTSFSTYARIGLTVGTTAIYSFAAGLLLVINNLDSYSSKVKDVGSNLSEPVTIMGTWERIGKNILANLKEITKEGSALRNSFDWVTNLPLLKQLTEGVGGAFRGLREGMDARKMEDQQPILDSINNVLDKNQFYRTKTLEPNLNQYSTGQFLQQNVSEDAKKTRNVSINNLIKKAMSGEKFELTDSQDFGSALAKMNERSFNIKKETTDNLNALTKDKEGAAALIGNDKITSYLDKLVTNKPVTIEESKFAESLINKLEPAQREAIETYKRSSKEVDIYSEKLNLLTKQTKLWADALQSVSGYLGNIAKAGGEQFSAGKGLQSVVEETQKKIQKTTNDFQAFMKELGNGEDLSQLSEEELKKRVEKFTDAQLKSAKDFKATIDASVAQMLQTSQLLIEGGYSTASKEAKRLEKELNESLKVGVLDPAALNEYLKTLNALKQQVFEDDLNWTQKQKSLYENMYDDRYKKYYENEVKIRKLDLETAQLQIDKAKSALEIAQKDKAKDETVRRNLAKDVEIAEQNYVKLKLQQYDQINQIREKAFDVEIELTNKEKSLYANLYDSRYKQYYTYNEKVRQLDLETAQLQVEKTKNALDNALKSSEQYSENVINTLKLDVENALANREKIKREQFDARLGETLKQIETKYQLHYFKLANLQLDNVDKSREITENEFQKNKELLNEQLNTLLEIQKSNNTPEIQRQIEEKKYQIVQNYATKVIAEFDRVAKKQQLEQSKIQNAFSLQNPILQVGVDLLDKQLDVLEKQRSVLDQQTNIRIGDLETVKGFLKTYAGQRDIDKQIIRQKEIALQRQIESEGMTLKIQKQQRDLKLEMLKIDQKMAENDAEQKAKDATYRAKSVQLDLQSGKQGVTSVDVERANVDAKFAQDQFELVKQKRVMIIAEEIANQNQTELDKYNSQIGIRTKMNDIARSRAATTLTPYDDVEVNQQILKRKDIPLPNLQPIFSQQGMESVGRLGQTFDANKTLKIEDISEVPKKQLTVLEEIRNALTSNSEKSLPHFADGGIVNRKTKAIIGEAGTEAVIPMPNGKSIPVTLQWNGYNVRSINGQNVLDTKDTKAIEAYKKYKRDNNREFDGMSLEQIEKYWIQRKMLDEKSLNNSKFLSSKSKINQPKPKVIVERPFGIAPAEASNVPMGAEPLKNNDDWMNPLTNTKRTNQLSFDQINRLSKDRYDKQQRVNQAVLDQPKIAEMRQEMSDSLRPYLSRKEQAIKFLDGILRQQGLSANMSEATKLIDILNSGKAGKDFDLKVGKDYISQQRFENFIKTGKYGKLNPSLNEEIPPTIKAKIASAQWLNQSPVEKNMTSNLSVDSQIKTIKENTEAIKSNTTKMGDNSKVITDWNNKVAQSLGQPTVPSSSVVKTPVQTPKVNKNSVLYQLQNNPLNKEFYDRVVENIKTGKGGTMFAGKLSEYDNFAFNLASKQPLNKAVEKNRESIRNVTPLSQKSTENKNSDKSNVVNNITLNIKVEGGNDAKSTAKNVGEELRTELYNIFNEVKFRMN